PSSVLTVQGHLIFEQGAQYVVRVAPAIGTEVAGVARLGNATVTTIFNPLASVSRQYKILSATAGIQGTFDARIVSNLPGFASSTLSYDSNDVMLNVNLNYTTAAPGLPRLNFNQASIANALTNFFNANGSIPGVFGALTPQGLTQITGEAAATTKQLSYG